MNGNRRINFLTFRLTAIQSHAKMYCKTVNVRSNTKWCLVYYNCGEVLSKLKSSLHSSDNDAPFYIYLQRFYLRVRGLSCEPNNQLNVCTTSVTEGEVGTVKHV